MTEQAWRVLEIAGGHQYAGNFGYRDERGKTYVYDSLVPNHRRLRRGDLIVVCDRRSMLSLGRIDRITPSAARKKLLRCPDCSTTSIKLRSTLKPRFRCDGGHKFEHARIEQVDCTAFIAHYVVAPPPFRGITSDEVRALCVDKSAQLSMRPLDLGRLRELVRECWPDHWPGILRESGED